MPSTRFARISLPNLPIEILAEILLYTCSPPTVLAVSRTCSFLYHTLAQNPAAAFIWRGVRRTCGPRPLPSLGPDWKGTEAELVSLMFSWSACEVCGKATRGLYASFAVRITLCGSWHCRRRFITELLVDASRQSPTDEQLDSLWIPYTESGRCLGNPFSATPYRWPNTIHKYLRKADWEKYQRDYAAYQHAKQARAERDEIGGSDAPSEEDENNKRIIERRDVAIKKCHAIMQICARLDRWKDDYVQVHRIIKLENKEWTKNFAEREGWNLDDLLSSQTYSSLLCRKNFVLERMVMDDMDLIRSAIESELLAMQIRRKRQTSEADYKRRLAEVKEIYERMCCGTLEHKGKDSEERMIVPTRSVFYELPSVRVLKGSPDPGVVPFNAPGDLKSTPLATSLIASDIHNWLIPVEAHLTRLLGYPNVWLSASTRILPPLQRVTARFFCRRCGEGNVGRAYQREKCLDVRGVCSHVCVAKQRERQENEDLDDSGEKRGRKKRKKKGEVKALDWAVDLFEKDEKAIRLIQLILGRTKLLEEESSTVSALQSLGGVIRCKSCEGWIVMDFETAIGHAHRHESMEFRLLNIGVRNPVMLKPGCTVSNLRVAFERGTCEILLGPSYRADNLRKKVNYGCKHCLRPPERHLVVANEKLTKGKELKAMDFNGLRSHLKEKHGISDVRDEDFFCFTCIKSGTEEKSSMVYCLEIYTER